MLAILCFDCMMIFSVFFLLFKKKTWQEVCDVSQSLCRGGEKGDNGAKKSSWRSIDHKHNILEVVELSHKCTVELTASSCSAMSPPYVGAVGGGGVLWGMVTVEALGW